MQTRTPRILRSVVCDYADRGVLGLSSYWQRSRRIFVGSRGTSMPSVLAVLRLITSSYLVGACTGRSAALGVTTRPARLDPKVFVRHPAELLEPLPECIN